MIRRNNRLVREYIYRKSLLGEEREIYEKKRKLKQAINKNIPIPTELRNDGLELNELIEADDAETKYMVDNLNNEYADYGDKLPKILITTSRNPSHRLKKFVKEMKLIFPNSKRINRGTTVISELANLCKVNEFTDLIVFHEHNGNPDTMIISHFPNGPTCYFEMSNCVLRHDLQKDKIETMSEAYPHIILDNFKSKLGDRIKNVLTYLFPIPKENTKRIMTFSVSGEHISFRHHIYKKLSYKKIELKEIGPRFEIKVYRINYGTLEIKDPEVEWVYRPFINTAKKTKEL